MTPTPRRASRRIIAAEQIETVRPDGEGLQEVVADKGYHSNESLAIARRSNAGADQQRAQPKELITFMETDAK